MANEKFLIFPGKFNCKVCDKEVTSLRLWIETGDATWMCIQKHVSKVALIPKKKKKKDFKNE